MKGKRVMITGASRGIGREAARALARKGADLVLVVRDRARGEEIASELRAACGVEVEVLVGDLSSLADVKRVAGEFLARHDRLDVLVNNAGALLMERQVTADGYEATFATNHLAYFFLTELLRGALEKAAPSRVVNVSSDAHHRGAMRWDDLMSEQRWSGWRAYCDSKLANVLFTTELARRLDGTGVTANALHPGVIASNFARNNRGVVGFAWTMMGPFLTKPDEGARTTVYLASSPEVEGVTGKYFVRCREAKPSRDARDPEAANRLWEISEELVCKAR